MRRNLLRFCLTFVLVVVAVSPLLAASPFQSAPITAIATANANLRSGPGATYTRTGGVKEGDTVTITGCTAAGDWCQLASGAWIAAELLIDLPASLPVVADDAVSASATATPAQRNTTLLPTPTPAAMPATTPAAVADAVTGPTAAAAANLRSGPGTSYEKVGSVAEGQPLAIVGRTEAGDWFQLEGGKWIAAFLVASAPAGVPVVVDVPAAPMAPAASETPVPAEAAPQELAGARNLEVSYINPHYNCEQSDLEFEGTPGITERVWGYRSFQIDMYIKNNSAEPIEPSWHPTRWIITDGNQEMVNDMMWQWISRYSGAYDQPTIFPGQQAGWTWIAFPVGRNEWVKAVEYEHNGQLYRQEFDLGTYGNAHNYVDCGVERNHPFYPTPTPRP